MIVVNSIRIILWNSGRKSIGESLYSVLSDRSSPIVLIINETDAFRDLKTDDFVLIGKQHSAGGKTQGLCIYVSECLQSFSRSWETDWSYAGYLKFPRAMVAGDLDFESTASVVDPNDGMLAEAEKSQFIFIGFFGTYRSPSLENTCLLYTSPSPRDQRGSRMPSSA